MRNLLLAFLLAAGCAQAAPLPSFKSVPNYMTPNMCDPFSWSVLSMLHAQGVPAQRIIYGWQDFGGPRGFHAAVLFQWEGRLYFMDNNRQGPRPVGGKTDLGCVNRIAGGFYTMCWMINEENERVAPRKIADLFAPAPEWLRQLQVTRSESRQ